MPIMVAAIVPLPSFTIQLHCCFSFTRRLPRPMSVIGKRKTLLAYSSPVPKLSPVRPLLFRRWPIESCPTDCLSYDELVRWPAKLLVGGQSLRERIAESGGM